jgi:hypothetical protein
MQTPEPHPPTTFRAPWTASVFLATVFILGGLLLMVGFRFVGMPWPAQCFIIAVILFGAWSSLEIALYRLCLTHDAITEFRWGWRSYQWSDVVGWTKWGDRLLFIKLNNGRIIGTDRPGFGDEDVAQLFELLSRYAGPMARGDQAVLPWYLEWTVGAFLRASPPT